MTRTVSDMKYTWAHSGASLDEAAQHVLAQQHQVDGAVPVPQGAELVHGRDEADHPGQDVGRDDDEEDDAEAEKVLAGASQHRADHGHSPVVAQDA